MVARRTTAGLLALLLLASLSAGAETVRVAVLVSRMVDPYRRAMEGFKEVLPGEYRVFTLADDAAGALEQLRSFKPRLVLALGSGAVDAAGSKLVDLPVVAAMVLRPRHLGKNVCGVALEVPARVHLRTLQRLVPGIKKVGMICNPASCSARLAEFKKAAAQLGLVLVSMGVSSRQEVIAAAKLLVNRVDAVYLPMDRNVLANFGFLSGLCLASGKPLATFSYRWVDKGALLAIYPGFAQNGRQAAGLARRLLDGESAAAIGLVGPQETEIAINADTASRLKIELPAWLQKMKPHVYGGK